MTVLTPHFDLPFRLSGTSFAVVEQDSAQDVANCVEAIIRTPNGFRYDAPEFGMQEVVLNNQPINTDLLAIQIQNQEPRASVLMSQFTDLLDNLIARLKIEVS